MAERPNVDNRSITIQESAIGSAIISGDGNIVYVIHQTFEQKTADTQKSDGEIDPNPYKGLAAFKEEDADRYFGREAQVERLWKRFQDLFEQSEAPRVLPILGPSGCGKSSLARAGLIPELARRPISGKEKIRVAVLVPGTRPVEALAGVLAKTVTQDPLPAEKAAEFERVLRERDDAGLFDGLRKIAALIPDITDSPLVILVDQFEEVYSLCKDAEARQVFINNLLQAASDSTGNVSILLTLRSDFLGEIQQHEALDAVIGSDWSIIVPTMKAIELRRAIVEPARKAGRPLNEAVVNLLIKDTQGREGALPLLQFALTRIWEERASDKDSSDIYWEMGGVGGALAGKAQEIYDSLNKYEKSTAQRVLLGLIQLGDGIQITRRRVKVANLVAIRDTLETVISVLRQFSAPSARLITLSSQKGQEIAEVTHEALFVHWQQLGEWLDDSRNDIRFQRRLEEVVNNWKQLGYPKGSLWRNPDLALLKSYHQRANDSLTKGQLRFLKESVRADHRRKAGFWAGIGTLLALCGITSLLAANAMQAEKRAVARRLALQAEWVGNQKSDLYVTSALLAVEAAKAFEKDEIASLEIDQALRSGLRLLPALKQQFQHGHAVLDLTFSPDGQKVASASQDNTARLWDINTGQELARLQHDDDVRFVTFSPDGLKLASASLDDTARLWDATTGKEIAIFKHDKALFSIAFSPDGQKIATASADNTVKLWNATTGKEIATLEHEEAVYSVMFSFDSQTVATSSKDKTARLWNASDGKETFQLQHESAVYSVVFSPNGKTIATASQDRTARLWNISSGEEIARFEHDGSVGEIAFSPNGQMLATDNGNYSALIWDLDSGKEIARLTHEGDIKEVVFSPDNQTIATGSDDDIVKLWDTLTGEELLRFNHEDDVRSVVFSPDGKTLASAGWDNTVRVWDLSVNQEPRLLRHEMVFQTRPGRDIRSVRSIKFSPDSRMIVSGDEYNTARIWILDTQSERIRFIHPYLVSSVDFSQDGRKIATTSFDNEVRLWEINASTIDAVDEKERLLKVYSDELCTGQKHNSLLKVLLLLRLS